MPILSRFNGIIIRMYFQQAEHNPPHIHAIYNEDVAAVCIKNGEILEGALPPKILVMVQKWVLLHQDELLQIWQTQHFIKLPLL